MRKAITYLQSCHQLGCGLPISMETVTDVSGNVSNKLIIFHSILFVINVSVLDSKRCR
jgi:hypothetical protein